MKIIQMKRGEGKTTALIKMSAEKQIPIYAMTAKERDLLIEKAKILGIDNFPTPLIPVDLYNFSNTRKVLIDELDTFMKYIYNIEIVAATLSEVEEMSFYELCRRAGLTPDDVEITDLKRYVK
jgi:hypothetical protein